MCQSILIKTFRTKRHVIIHFSNFWKYKMDSLPCDVCGKAITDYEGDLYHFSGMLNDKSCNHIHVCKKCFDSCNQDLYGVSVKDGLISRVMIKNKFDNETNDLIKRFNDKSKPFDMEIERILSDDEINALLKGFEK